MQSFHRNYRGLVRRLDASGRDIGLRIVFTVAGTSVGLSTLVPWATFDALGSPTTNIGPGDVGVALVGLALVVVGLSWMPWPVRTRLGIWRALILTGGVSELVSVGLALNAIANANSTSAPAGAPGPTVTSHAYGAAVAIAASGAIVVVSAIRLNTERPAGGTDRRPTSIIDGHKMWNPPPH
jgi:hypothetical protein